MKIENLNDLAKYVTKLEGKKKNQNIGEVKEQVKITLTVLANLPYSKVARLLKRYEE